MVHWNRYINFIYSRKFREIPENFYTEKHHIIPKVYNGTDDKCNMIELTAREHFIAHMMLWKCFSGSMTYAFWMMYNQNGNKYNKLSSRQYEVIKMEHAKNVSLFFKGRPMPEEAKEKIGKANKGKKRSEEAKEKMSQNRKGKGGVKGRLVSKETREKLSKANKGRKLTEKQKRKISNTLKGRPSKLKGIPISDEHKKKIGNTLKGREFTEGHKRKISEANRGQIPWHKGKTGVYSDETLEKMREVKRGKIVSDETRQKIREHTIGKTHTDGTKKKLSILTKNTKWITKNSILKRVKEKDVKKYMDDGWYLGKIPQNRRKKSA